MAAVECAFEAGLRPPLALFVNVEPGALHGPVPYDFKSRWLRATQHCRIVLDVGEGALVSSPADVLWSLEGARDRGWGVALDDAGADARGPALLPFLRPDVVKLDLGFLRGRPAREMASVIHAVGAQSERAGVIVAAEGIETEADAGLARAVGATLGQGWLYGRPESLPESFVEPVPRIGIGASSWAAPVGFTPFDILRRHRPVRRATKPILLAMSRSLEDKAMTLGEPPVVLSGFQDDRFFGPEARARYGHLAANSAFVAAFATGMSPAPVRGVRGVRLFSRDPLGSEWVVVVLGSHFSAAIAGRDVGDEGNGQKRRFDYVVVHERSPVTEVALSLMTKVLSL
jgi:hypothetical protein